MQNRMYTPLFQLLRSFPLALLLLAGGCSGDEPATKAEAAPDADVLAVLGVPASPGAQTGKGEEQEGVPASTGKVPSSEASPEAASGAAPDASPLKVEISEPRFDSGKQAPAPRVPQSPGSSLDY